MSDDVPQDDEQRAAQAKARVIQHPALKQTRQPLNWGALEQRGEPPARDWAVDHWLGMGHVTLLAGKGGIGKSILSQQLASCLALGESFIEHIPQPRNVLYWASEDDHDELWRRQRSIASTLDRPLTAFSRLHIIPLGDAECTLFDVAPLSRDVVRTSILEELREQVGDLRIEVLILDNIARLFGGNENDRHHVTTFLAALNYAAAPMRCAVLLLGHVAKAKDSESSGSTAWENAARARLWLTDKPADRPEDEDEDSDDSLRYLHKRKVNYASKDVAILRYQEGAYSVVTPPAGPGGIIGSINREHAKRVCLSAMGRLQSMGLWPCESTASPHYLPKLVLQHGLAEGFTKRDLGQGMRELMNDGKLKRDIVGRNQNRSAKYGLTVAPGPA